MFLKIGHRGAAGLEPENTLLSFKKALDFNVDMVELDVHLCKTGELVVIHDKKVNRTTNGKGYIRKKTLKELKELNAGKGEKIPTLKEVLSLINRKAKINIELKGEKTAEPVAKIINFYILKRKWAASDFIVSSFNLEKLKKFKKLNPKIKIGIIFRKIPRDWPKLAKEIGAYLLNINLKSADKEFISQVHKRKLKVFVWTLNKASEIKKIKEAGVDGIFSDFPNRF